jgi:hypothetical protein
MEQLFQTLDFSEKEREDHSEELGSMFVFYSKFEVTVRKVCGITIALRASTVRISLGVVEILNSLKFSRKGTRISSPRQPKDLQLGNLR